MAPRQTPAALIATGIVTGGPGAFFAVKGTVAIKRADSRNRKANDRYDAAHQALEAYAHRTNKSLSGLGALQEDAIRTIVERMADFLRRHEKQVTDTAKLLADGLEPGHSQVVIAEGLGQDATSWTRGALGIAITAVGIPSGVRSTVGKYAAASTGTRIKKLHGAAKTNAIEAYLGGGSKASGGGGMAAGSTAVKSASIGTALLVGGLLIARQGEKAKTTARANEAEVAEAIAEMELTKARFDVIIGRVDEFKSMLDQLAVRATAALDQLDSEPFDLTRHETQFHQAMTLTIAVRDVAMAPVIDDAGELNEETASLKVRYRALIKEETNE